MLRTIKNSTYYSPEENALAHVFTQKWGGGGERESSFNSFISSWDFTWERNLNAKIPHVLKPAFETYSYTKGYTYEKEIYMPFKMNHFHERHLAQRTYWFYHFSTLLGVLWGFREVDKKISHIKLYAAMTSGSEAEGGGMLFQGRAVWCGVKPHGARALGSVIWFPSPTSLRQVRETELALL